MNITWRQVLDSDAVFARPWGHISKFLPIVQEVGYRYFAWNGKIYMLISMNPLDYKDTGLTVEDLECQ